SATSSARTRISASIARARSTRSGHEGARQDRGGDARGRARLSGDVRRAAVGTPRGQVRGQDVLHVRRARRGAERDGEAAALGQEGAGTEVRGADALWDGEIRLGDG